MTSVNDNAQRLPDDICYEKMPHFQVNLDAPAQTRWNHVIRNFSNELQQSWTVMDAFLKDLIPSFLVVLLRIFPHSSELIGISKIVGKWPGDLGLMHIGYELTAFCTSILINDENVFGTINLRTMDWGMPFDLRPLTAKIDFTNNRGDIVYTSVMFIGVVGVVSAMKPRQYGIVINFRNSSYNNVDHDTYLTCQTILGFVYNFLMIFVGGWTVTCLIRYICEHADDYESAVEMAKHHWLISPTYITITGNTTNQGVVITRDRLKCVDVHDVREPRVYGHGSNGDAHNSTHCRYVVQCNCDHWNIDKLNQLNDIYDSEERHEMAVQMLPALLSLMMQNASPAISKSKGRRKRKKKKKPSHAQSETQINVVDGDYADQVQLTQQQLEFINACWRFLSANPICNEETVYANLIIPKYGVIFSGLTTTQFEGVSAQEFKDMFYMSSSSLMSNKTN